MGLMNKIMSALHPQASGNKDTNPYKRTNRKSGLFSTTYKNAGYRGDKAEQEQLRKDLNSKKKFHMENPQSERYQINGSNTLYDDVALADKDIANGNTDAKVKNAQVASTAIHSFDYDPKTENLDIQFQGGSKKYRFPDVPKEVVSEWLEAPSKGKFYNAVLKEYSTNR